MKKLTITDKNVRDCMEDALERYGCAVIDGLPSGEFNLSFKISEEIIAAVEAAIQRAKGGA